MVGKPSRYATTLIALLALAGCGGSAATSSNELSTPSSGTTSSAPPVKHKPSPARHAPRRVASAWSGLGRRSKTSGCAVRGQLPDLACTPGGVFRAAGVSQICRPGYSTSVRNVSLATKRAVYAEYGTTPARPGAYEVDHLIPLEVGGNNSVANLWPEIAPGYHEKDQVENELHDAVCSGRIALRTAQIAIARDWRHAGVAAPARSGSSGGGSGSGSSGSGSGGSSGPGGSGAAGGSGEGPGSSSHAGDAAFCSSHRCIANFPNGHGTVVQCADGEWSHSGGLQGVCNRHGGPR
jgi:hypothetical protein